MSIEALAFPFSVGMLAAFNPCGFAMLPTYIGYFIGTGDTCLLYTSDAADD